MKNIKIVFFVLLISAFKIGFSQEEKATPHVLGFKIVMNDPKADVTKYENAASGYFYFDQFRFLNKRREMKFEDGKATIVLYSANEMLANTQKLVSPHTIKDGAKYKEYVLAITLDGNSVKPMPLTND